MEPGTKPRHVFVALSARQGPLHLWKWRPACTTEAVRLNWWCLMSKVCNRLSALGNGGDYTILSIA
eukprot:1140615-Pelagomonas_calceolata.AAC.3